MGHRREQGQVLVQVAAVLIALLLVIGLVIDYSLVLTTRRQLQNAADAGALAGARELCTGTRSQAVAAAEDYAARNGATDVTVEIHNLDGDVDPDGSVIWVEVHSEAPLTLLALAGVDRVDVHSTAASGCQQTGSACGLWPIAFPQDVYETLACGSHIYIWDDDKIEYDCGEWGCDIDGDGTGDAIFHNGERGWLDFSGQFDTDNPGTCGSAGGASLIKALIEDECAGQITLPKCIPGEPGTKASAESPVENRVGDHVLIPLFSSIGCNGDDYYIEGIACVEVVAYHKKITIETWDAANNQWVSHKNEKAIEVIVSCDNCPVECGISSGQPASPGGGDAIVIGLTE